MSIEFEFEGMDEVLKGLDEPLNPERLRNALTRACLLVEREAKKKAPKGDGTLQRSITSEVRQDGLNPIGVVFTPLEYAPYVEFGTGLFAEAGGRKDVPWCYQDDKGEWHTTSGQHPQPFMRPALDENREAIKQILREGLLNG